MCIGIQVNKCTCNKPKCFTIPLSYFKYPAQLGQLVQLNINGVSKLQGNIRDYIANAEDSSEIYPFLSPFKYRLLGNCSVLAKNVQYKLIYVQCYSIQLKTVYVYLLYYLPVYIFQIIICSPSTFQYPITTVKEIIYTFNNK